jgi:hypothetical protein
MSITRLTSPTKLICYRDTATMLAASTGNLNQLYVIPGGVILDYGTYNETYIIEIFQDANLVLHGLFVRK